MSIKILNQALLFKNDKPNFSSIKELNSKAVSYQDENGCSFLYARRREKAYIKDKKVFFEFVSDVCSVNVSSFDDITKALNPQSRAEAIEISGDSKHRYIKVFDQALLISLDGSLNTLYTYDDLEILKDIKSFVAVENGETFLKMRGYKEHFKTRNFIYLAGYSNSFTKEFLKDKDVEFFLDFDIEALNIYESFECKSKFLHIPKSLESFFKSKKSNVELYKKQRARLKDTYSDELKPLLSLIRKYNTVVEQEIIYETH